METTTHVSVAPGEVISIFCTPKVNLDEFKDNLCKQILELEEFHKTVSCAEILRFCDLYLTLLHKLIVDTFYCSSRISGYFSLDK